MIELVGITKEFKKDFWSKPFKALDNVSFKVNEGEIVGYLGANGAGKTTSLKIILNFIKATSGQVIFSSKLGQDRETILKNIGYLPERPYFYPHLTGRDFIKFLGSLSQVSDAQVKNMTEKWAKRLRIDFALDREIKSYSKGMLQRLGFVTALIHDPKFIILDEPVSGLDPIGRREIKDSILEINKEGKTIFFSSHIVPDIEEICHSIVFLEKGKLSYQGSIHEMLLETKGKIEVIKKDLLQDRIFTDLIDNHDKLSYLNKFDYSKFELISLNPHRISLEEYLYKTKGYHHEIS